MKKILIVIIILLVIILISSMSKQKLLRSPYSKRNIRRKRTNHNRWKRNNNRKTILIRSQRKSCTNLWIQRLLLWRRNLQHNRQKRRWNSLGKSSTRRHTKEYKILHERSKIFKIHLPPRGLGKETRLPNKKTM